MQSARQSAHCRLNLDGTRGKEAPWEHSALSKATHTGDSRPRRQEDWAQLLPPAQEARFILVQALRELGAGSVLQNSFPVLQQEGAPKLGCWLHFMRKAVTALTLGGWTVAPVRLTGDHFLLSQ